MVRWSQPLSLVRVGGLLVELIFQQTQTQTRRQTDGQMRRQRLRHGRKNWNRFEIAYYSTLILYWRMQNKSRGTSDTRHPHHPYP
jgi:hypothetical protein